MLSLRVGPGVPKITYLSLRACAPEQYAQVVRRVDHIVIPSGIVGIEGIMAMAIPRKMNISA
jgi:hypothetical protein